MIKATLLLVVITGLMMGCMSPSTSMDHSNTSPMLQQTDYQSEPSHQKYMNDKMVHLPKLNLSDTL